MQPAPPPGPPCLHQPGPHPLAAGHTAPGYGGRRRKGEGVCVVRRAGGEGWQDQCVLRRTEGGVCYQEGRRRSVLSGGEWPGELRPWRTEGGGPDPGAVYCTSDVPGEKFPRCSVLYSCCTLSEVYQVQCTVQLLYLE